MCPQYVRDETLGYNIGLGFGIAGQHGDPPHICIVWSFGSNLYRNWPSRLAPLLPSVSTTQYQSEYANRTFRLEGNRLNRLHPDILCVAHAPLGRR